MIAKGVVAVKVTNWISYEKYDSYTSADDMGNESWERAYNTVLNHCKDNRLKVGGFV